MKLTIAMAVYDDYDGLFFTVQSLRMHHPICMTDDVEFLVMDTNPDSAHGKAVESLCRSIPNCRYLTVSNNGGWSKYKAFDHSKGDVVMVLDCHVLLHSGAIEAVLAYFECRDTPDMLQGPCVFDCLKAYGTHFEPQWRDHDFGIWATNSEACEKGDPFEIPMMGMGCFAIRRSDWQGISDRFKGFGSEEWYMAEKVRSWGGGVMCHPDFRWTHRWGRPNGVPYPFSLEDKIYNYAVGWSEIYGSGSEKLMEMENHFATQIDRNRATNIMLSAIHL